jgi:hypothetical protein
VPSMLPLVVGSSTTPRASHVSDGCCRFEAQCNKLRQCFGDPSVSLSRFVSYVHKIQLAPCIAAKGFPSGMVPLSLILLILNCSYKHRVTLQTSPTDNLVHRRRDTGFCYQSEAVEVVQRCRSSTYLSLEASHNYTWRRKNICGRFGPSVVPK